ncbi:MAG: tRNA pseudouridine(38-40) synthase TruA [Ferrimicrobium sp.]
MVTAWVVSYDGARFHGAAKQPGLATVAGAFGSGLEVALRRPVAIQIAGRTDAGVHARGQVFSVDDPGAEVGWVGKINSMISPQGASVRIAVELPATFHARFSARWRHYVYRIQLTAVPDPLWGDRAWGVPFDLDVAAMQRAAGELVGTHDFSALCRAKSAGGFMRELTEVAIVPGFGFLDVVVVGRSFCHQLVRRLVGALVDVGRGRQASESVSSRLASCDRRMFPSVAPPWGLYLWRVGYGDPPVGVAESYRINGFEREWVSVVTGEFQFPLD